MARLRATGRPDLSWWHVENRRKHGYFPVVEWISFDECIKYAIAIFLLIDFQARVFARLAM
ncbi:hypothetical protein A6V36_20025 [Paraburkholderia ginsengiterrae]|uniref:Uncharacterized protein n=1 Tax=Paraburkholderia ginsengiterrae TaxID=1462993 RepID=A0ABX2V377_9BURK|nr:hypothetical protein A6V36_20025 [Paraburkholderia ginsengiterrae]